MPAGHIWRWVFFMARNLQRTWMTPAIARDVFHVDAHPRRTQVRFVQCGQRNRRSRDFTHSVTLRAAMLEASETSVQPAQETGCGDLQAQRLLSRGEAEKAELRSIRTRIRRLDWTRAPGRLTSTEAWRGWRRSPSGPYRTTMSRMTPEFSAGTSYRRTAQFGVRRSVTAF